MINHSTGASIPRFNVPGMQLRGNFSFEVVGEEEPSVLQAEEADEEWEPLMLGEEYEDENGALFYADELDGCFYGNEYEEEEEAGHLMPMADAFENNVSRPFSSSSSVHTSSSSSAYGGWRHWPRVARGD